MSNLHLDILKGTDEYLEPSDLFVQGKLDLLSSSRLGFGSG